MPRSAHGAAGSMAPPPPAPISLKREQPDAGLMQVKEVKEEHDEPAAVAATPSRSSRNFRAQLRAEGAETGPLAQIWAVRNSRGMGWIMLGNFVVTGVDQRIQAGSSLDRKLPVESLVCVRCDMCRHTFAWDAAGAILRTAKRQRLALPCGHQSFRREFSFCMHLQDKDNQTEVLTVCVSDSVGAFFGLAPDDVAEDMALRGQAQQLLDALLARPQRGPEAHSHCLSAFRVDGPGTPGGAWVVTDTRLVPLQ